MTLSIMRLALFVTTLAALACPANSNAADDRPTPTQLASAVSLALDPARSSTRNFKIEMDVPGNPSVVWNGKQMRKSIDGKRHVLTLLTDPPGVAGFAILATEEMRENGTLWMYVPPVRRVRRLVHEGRRENFLGTDFSLGDFSFFALDPAAMQVIGKVSKDGLETWAVKESWNAPTGYSQILTWVTLDSHIPVRREYYDASGALWKTDTRTNVVDVNGLATPLVVTATDAQQGSKSVLTYDSIESETELSDDLFDPRKLGSASERAAAPAGEKR